MVFHLNGIQNSGGIAMVICTQTDFKAILIRQDRENYYILYKGNNNQKDMTFMNAYESIGEVSFIK